MFEKSYRNLAFCMHTHIHIKERNMKLPRRYEEKIWEKLSRAKGEYNQNLLYACMQFLKKMKT